MSVELEVAGTSMCATAIVLGHGTREEDGRIDIGNDLFMPRRNLAAYPADRPMGVTISPQFKTGDGVQYTLFFGIGGLRKDEWVAPLSKPVLPGERAYANSRHPERVGAYVQLSRQTIGTDGVALTSGQYFSKSGTVTFRTIDLQRGRYAGRVELVFARTGDLAPQDGPDVVEVIGDFDLSRD